MSDSSQVLASFHAALVQEIRTHRPEYLNGPFTVAEIYQNLVPYSSHRDTIGVDMNGDYEAALLRLLAGEGGYLVLESEPALRNLREELESSNPNTGLYREFAAVDVRLNPAFVGAGAGGGTHAAVQAPAHDEAVSMADLAPPTESERDAFEEAEAVEAIPQRAGRPSGAEPPGACRWCRAELPDRDSLNFCPFCGTDVNVVPCPGCGEELEPEWRFCVSCGTEVGA